MVCLNISITEKKKKKKKLLGLSPDDHSLYFQSKTVLLYLLLLGPKKGKGWTYFG